ncbi:MAG: hypothetical protein K0S51_2104 [Bacillales bacterium]|jgi:hypothetical protein|nr:hypothetical protein [Bacillales bacterium]
MTKFLVTLIIILNIAIVETVHAKDVLTPKLLIVGNITQENFNERNSEIREVIKREVAYDVTSLSEIKFCSEKGMTSSELKRLFKYGNKECPNIYQSIKNAKVIAISTSGAEFDQLISSKSLTTRYRKADIIKGRYINNVNEIILKIRGLNKEAIILIPKLTKPTDLGGKYNFIISEYIKSWNEALESISSKEETIVLYRNQKVKINEN